MTQTTDYRRILLIKPSSLGDVIHALPVLHGLRVRFPRAHIAWLVASACAPLIRHHPELDEVIEFDRHRFGRVGRSLQISREFAGFVQRLRVRGFDLAIDLQGLFRSGFLAFSSGAPTRVGFRTARELAWMFYTHEIDTPDLDAHAVDKNYLAAPLLGFAHVPITFDLAVTDAERSAARNMLVDHGVDITQPYAAVLPGARWDTKRWLADRFASLISRLAVDHSMPTVVLGGSDETELCGHICSQTTSPKKLKPANLAGKSGLRDLVAILEQASAVVCHDSAPAHVAAALGRPMVCILGPTNPNRTGPYATQARLLQANLTCAPCYLRQRSQCRYEHACMHEIDVEEVMAATTACLAGNRAAGDPGGIAPAANRSVVGS